MDNKYLNDFDSSWFVAFARDLSLPKGVFKIHGLKFTDYVVGKNKSWRPFCIISFEATSHKIFKY